jgi:hypothetical protein
MIQKIRSYLLENKEIKESIGWYVAIIMLVPLFSYFFISQRAKKNSIGSVNGTEINAAIFNLKLYQQSLILESVYKQLGKKEADYLVSLFFQGRSPEEFLLLDAIKHAYLSFFFKKYVFGQQIAQKKVLFDSLKNQEQFKQIVGDVFFSVIKKKAIGDGASGIHFDRFITMKQVDEHIEEVYQNNALFMMFQGFIGSIERKILKDFVIQKKVNLISYTFDKKKNGNQLKKLIDIGVVSDEQLRHIYEAGLSRDLYLRNKIYTFSFAKYGIRDAEKKDFFKNIARKDKKKAIEKKLAGLFSLEELKDKATYEKVLENHFKRMSESQDGKIEICPEGEKRCSLVSLPGEVKDFVVSVDGHNIFVFDDSIYFIHDVQSQKLEILPFEEARDLVLSHFMEERINELLEEKATVMRYELEENGKATEGAFWKEEQIDFDVLAAKKNAEKSSRDAVILRKLSVGGFRKGSTFVSVDDSNFAVFCVSGVEEDESLPLFYSKRDSAASFGVFFENTLRQAHIDIYQRNKDAIVQPEAEGEV